MSPGRPILAILTVVCLFLCKAALAETDLTTEEQNYLQAHGPVIFVSQSQYAPFEFISEQKTHDGMCIELARWIATEFGFKAQFIDTSFAEAQQMIQTGKADVLTSFFYSEKRDQNFDFTDTMFYIPATIFVSADRPDIKDLNDLSGKTIAIQKGDYAEDFLKERQLKFTVLHTANFSEAADKVISGQADAVIGDEQIVLYHLYSNNLEKRLKKVGQPLYTGENAMAVIEGNTPLASILNKGIRKARERGVIENINKIWLGSQLTPKANWLYQYRWQLGIALVAFFILLIGSWLWNISLRQQVQRRTQSLRENEQFLNTLIEHLPVMLFVKEAANLSFVKFNRTAEITTGFKSEELYRKNDYDFFPKQQADFFVAKDRAALNSRQPTIIEEEAIQTKTGEERKLRTIKVPIVGEDGQPSYLLGISEDITTRLENEQARKRSEQQLKAALKEKETLLKEVHHRVKNNMQVISSLLNLQAQSIKDPALEDVFNEATGRIRVMSLVHEKLYQSESFARISAQDFLQMLASQLESIYRDQQQTVLFQIDADDLSLSVDDAIPFGLITTEIITNALKYAFADRTSGTIMISLKELEDNRCELQISDDGIGLSDLDPATATSLGLRLIRDLTEGHLEGSWQVDGTAGTNWTIRW